MNFISLISWGLNGSSYPDVFLGFLFFLPLLFPVPMCVYWLLCWAFGFVKQIFR